MKRRLANWLRHFPPLRWGLMLGVKLFVPRHPVGVVGVVFNSAGQILLLEHVFRPYYPWGLPGGWIEPGEDPAQAVQRELKEELQLQVEAKQLLLCERQDRKPGDQLPPGLGIAFYCRLANDEDVFGHTATSFIAHEILSVAWVALEEIEWKLTPLEQKAIILAKEAFDRDQIVISEQ